MMNSTHHAFFRNAALKCAALALAVLTVACSYLPDSKKIDYGTAVKAPPLDIPPDLTKPANTGQYTAPGVSGTVAASQANGRKVVKNDTVLADGTGTAHIERDGNQRWLVVSVPADKAWDVTKAFWQENGFLLTKDDPQTGVMETDWAENRASLSGNGLQGFFGRLIGSLQSTAERDMYRTRLEKGSKPGTTEIYISHRGLVEVFINEGKEQTRWQPRDADPTLEAEMLRRLLFKFDGANPDDPKLQAKQVDGAKPVDRARVVKTQDGGVLLVVDDDFDRSWRRVGLALDRVGFAVEDRERDAGLYYVRYVDTDDKATQDQGDSFWSKLAFWRSSKNDAIPKKTQYRVNVREQKPGGPTNVTVLRSNGQPDTSPIAKQILDLLQQQLR